MDNLDTKYVDSEDANSEDVNSEDVNSEYVSTVAVNDKDVNDNNVNDNTGKPLTDLKFIPMTPDEPSNIIIPRVIAAVQNFSEEITNAKLYEYKAAEPPEYMTEVMADRKYFLEIFESIKTPVRYVGGLIAEVKTPAHVIDIFCPNPYGLALTITNKLYVETKNPTINMRTIVEYEEIWIDFKLRPTIHIFAFLPNSADSRQGKAIQLIRAYSIKNVTYIPPEIELISLYDTYCLTHEEINDKDLFHMAIKRYKAHLADLMTGLGSDFKKSITAQINEMATSGQDIADDDLYSKLSNSGRIISSEIHGGQIYGGKIHGDKIHGDKINTSHIKDDKSKVDKIDTNDEPGQRCKIGPKSCGDRKKDLLFQIKVDIVQRIADSVALFGSWALPITKVNHNHIQLMCASGIGPVFAAAKAIAATYQMRVSQSATHATCVPKELRLTTTYIKLHEGPREHIICEYVNTMEYQPMAIVRREMAIGTVYTLDKYGLLKYIFMNLYTLNTVRTNEKIDIKKYIFVVYQYCEMALKIRKMSDEISGLMGIYIPFIEWRKTTALESNKHASYAPYEWFIKNKALRT